MNISLNGQPLEFQGQSVAELIAAQMPPPPFAVAVNTRFVPKSQYAHQPLQEGDRLEVIAPVTGG